MARFIASESNPLWPAQEWELRKLFGVGGKWPKEGCKLRFIQGIAVHVLPADHVSLRRTDGRKSSTHRVIAACPDCGVAVSAGRLRQHKCNTKRPRLPPGGGRRGIDRVFQTAELKNARAAVPDLRQLAQAVYVHAWETQEYEDAFNAFCEAAGNHMNRKQRLEWDRWCLKATSNEIIEEALRILGLEPVPAPVNEERLEQQAEDGPYGRIE